MKSSIFQFSYRSSVKKVLVEPYTDQSILDKAECMDLVKYDLAIVTMEISVSTYSEMVREEATSIGNAHCSPNQGCHGEFEPDKAHSTVVGIICPPG